MKQFVLIVGVIASLFVLVSCKSPATNEPAYGSTTSSAPMHKDYKGEAGLK